MTKNKPNRMGRLQKHWDEFDRKWRQTLGISPAMRKFAKRDSRRYERQISRIDATDAQQREREEYADEYEEDEHACGNLCLTHPSSPQCLDHLSRHIVDEEDKR